ncbi:tubulin--tyrosine ligase-like protein 12 [Clytia hemisphaerica]|uniref:SET domain-containing protein n=1 Tax=Clytia hemisphaerica TaxID=252671 RepID=A0A7M5UWN4_9CNID|eukprot:TCONS_00050396-protein
MSTESHLTFKDFLSIYSDQLESIPNNYWPSLFQKLTQEIFDIGEYVSLCKDEEEGWHVMVIAEDGLNKDDPNSVFLVDHAWTYEVKFAKKQLEQHDNLLNRMKQLMDIDHSTEKEEAIEEVLQRMWKFNKCYHRKESMLLDGDDELNNNQMQKDRDYIPLWYVMDEVGSRVNHDDNPNFAFKPFYFLETDTTFTVIFPLQDLEYGEEVTRDYQSLYTDQALKDVMLYPWEEDRINLDEVHDDWIEKYTKELENTEEEQPLNCPNGLQIKTEPPYAVCTDSDYAKYLTNENFYLVDHEEKADIIYKQGHYRQMRKLLLEGRQYVLEQPNKNCLVLKNFLAETCQRHTVQKYLGREMPQHIKERRGPIWLPTTFNLNTELPQFIKHFKERQAKGQYNVWIVKPTNLARSLGIEVSDNLTQIIRLAEAGPRIVCEYISDISLFPREDTGLVKWEIRHFAFVKSVEPLEVFVHNLPYVRFANKKFELNDFTDFQKHFTNMYYRHRDKMLVFPWKEFYPEHYNKALPNVPYEKLEAEIFKMIKELFESATSRPPPFGLGRSPQCRGYYAIDMILRWRDEEHTEIQPMLLESNFVPCMTRALEDDPELMNDIFGAFFLGTPPERMIRL